ncbi:MAG: calcium-binding protein, partial [Solirubrobacteraceae bacterium]
MSVLTNIPKSHPSALVTRLLAGCAAALACLLTLPLAASAQLSVHLTLTEGNTWLLTIISDEASDHIALSCSNNLVLINGESLVNRTGQHMACTASQEAPQEISIYGEGGDDTIDTSKVTVQGGFRSLLLPTSGGLFFYAIHLDGGPGKNTLIGGPLPEEFNSPADAPNNSGGDIIYGNGGNDKIYGTTGADKIYGGTGHDAVEPLAGADIIRGGPGADTIIDEGFDKSHDRFYGEAGNDEIFGGAGNDLIEGGPGNDFLHGLGGNDTIIGGPGKDALYGEAGND